MTCYECVVLAFARLREAGKSHLGANSGYVAPCEQLVRIALMPDVPHNGFPRRIKDIMQRHGKLHRAEVRSKMPAGYGNFIKNFFAKLEAKLVKLVFIKSFYSL